MINIRVIAFTGFAVLFSAGAFAKSAGLPMGGKKHDNKTPIEITSDSLDVLQEKNQAIFIGHVVAIQGDVRLKSDKMTITYSKPADNPDNKDKPKKSEADKDANKNGINKNAIKKIDVNGTVFLTTADETASGDYGTYDVEHQEITLNDHVVLTRDQNVLKGDKLVYNLDTGKSTVSSATEQSTDGKSNGRVHALFLPENKKQ